MFRHDDDDHLSFFFGADEGRKSIKYEIQHIFIVIKFRSLLSYHMHCNHNKSRNMMIIMA